MAQFEQITINGVQEEGINIRKIVGWAGADLEEDVMLIQTVFEYISIGMGPEVFSLDMPFKPEFRGYMDNDTLYALGEFQIRYANRLLKDTYRRIHPASYKNRRISDSKRLMTITLLHVFAKNSAFFQGHSSYTQKLLEMEPRLAKFTDYALINS